MTKSIYFSRRKEYYRRKHISISMKIYHQTGFTIKERKEKAIKFVEKVVKPLKRIRRQVCFNSSYYISLRAITINTSVTKKELEDALDEFLRNNEQLLHIPFDVSAFEEEQLDTTEDLLTEGVIHIELNVRGHQTFVRL